MARNQKNSNIQIEINDLLDEAINNALERRNQNLDVDTALSEDEAANIAGGQITSITLSVAIAGYLPINLPIIKPIRPPIIVGLIAHDYGTLL